MDHPVEIKSNVEPLTIDDALADLGLSDGDAEPRSIWFCSSGTDERPTLTESGVILRVRRTPDSADTTLKLRPCVETRLPRGWSTPTDGDGWEFRIEHDWSSGPDPVLAASFVLELDGHRADAALADGDATALLSADQRKLFHDYTGRSLDPTRLRLLGPVQARRWKVRLDDHKITCEEWVASDQLRFLELSAREEEPARAKKTRRQLLALYARRGVQISTAPETKTQLVLDYFSVGSWVM